MSELEELHAKIAMQDAALAKLGNIAKNIKIPEPKLLQLGNAAPESNGQQSIKLDEADSLRLENLMLRTQISDLTVKLAEFEKKDNQQRFTNHIVSKFNIDTTKFNLNIDTSTYTLQLSPK